MRAQERPAKTSAADSVRPRRRRVARISAGTACSASISSGKALVTAPSRGDASRLAGVIGAGLALVLSLPLLQGCVAALAAAQAVPAAIGLGSIAGADDRNPFRHRMPSAHGASSARAGNGFAELDRRLQLAECGDAASQYWVASAMDNSFNASPDRVEIYKWYKLAQLARHAEASVRVAALDATMAEHEILAARERVADWRPRTQGCPDAG